MPQRDRWRSQVCVLVAYAAVALAFSWPLPRDLGTFHRVARRRYRRERVAIIMLSPVLFAVTRRIVDGELPVFVQTDASHALLYTGDG